MSESVSQSVSQTQREREREREREGLDFVVIYTKDIASDLLIN